MRAVSIILLLAGLLWLAVGGEGMDTADTHADNVQGLWCALFGLVLVVGGAALAGRAFSGRR